MPKYNPDSRVRDVLRDPEHMDFLIEQIRLRVDDIRKAAIESGTQERDRPVVRRLLLIERSLSYKAELSRGRSGEDDIAVDF